MKAALEYLREADPYITIMEVCGTHTAAIARSGLRSLLPIGIRLVSGPGCPVCVTGAGYIDGVIDYAMEADAVVLSFGDMLRVPGSRRSFAGAKAAGGDFRVLYSPLEAVALAEGNPERQFVLAAVGFETTAPLFALVLETVIERGIRNLKLATAVKTMPAAMGFICEHSDVHGFICPGHVAAVIGAAAFRPLLRYGRPMVIAGFEAGGIAGAIARIVKQAGGGLARLENLYPSVVSENGNEAALALTAKYFEAYDANWRGIGVIADSGLRLRRGFAEYELAVSEAGGGAAGGCICHEVLLGKANPSDCPLFGEGCTPENPVGACMVSAEGACGVWYREGTL